MKNTPKMKIMIGAFAHESNDFCPTLTKIEDFEFAQGDAVLDLIPVRDVFDPDEFELIPSIYAVAQSSGLVETDAYLYFEKLFIDVLSLHPDIDGIWMFCHGAMNVVGIGSGENRLMKKFRELVGPNCIISLGMDLHGNIEEEFYKYVNLYRCYHTAPHTDQEETYRFTARLLIDHLRRGYKAVPEQRKIPMIFPGEMAATTTEPFKSIVRIMKNIEANDERVACISTFIGFAWTDAERTSSTIVVIPSSSGDQEYCRQLADEFAELVFSRRKEFSFETLALPPDQTVDWSLNRLEAPVVVTDMGDNPTAGTTGGSTVLLQEYMEHQVPHKKVLIAGIYDPLAYQKGRSFQKGEEFVLNIGVGIDLVTTPIPISCFLIWEGEVQGYSTPSVPPIARCNAVVVRHKSIDIIITDKPYAFTQLVNFESVKIEPASYHVVVTKFGYIYPELKLFSRSAIMSDTPGESNQNIKSFDYKHIKRPIYPLDDI